METVHEIILKPDLSRPFDTFDMELKSKLKFHVEERSAGIVIIFNAKTQSKKISSIQIQGKTPTGN